MRTPFLRLICLFFFCHACMAAAGPQQAPTDNSQKTKNAQSRAKTDSTDTRPLGKYLYALCTVSRDGTDAGTCKVVDPCQARAKACVAGRAGAAKNIAPISASLHGLAQNISISLVCDSTGATDCDASYPLVAGSEFFVRAATDSGQPVTITIASGPAVMMAPGPVPHYRAQRAGTIVIHAEAAGDATYLPAPPVDLLVQVVAVAKDQQSCALLPAQPSESSSVDATAIVMLLGTPNPFTLTAASSNVIAIYTTREGLNDADALAYRDLVADIGVLSGDRAGALGVPPATKAFTVELRIPHAQALGDLATRLGTLNYSQFTLQDVGRDIVRVSATTAPDCKTWTSFLDDIRHVEWQLVSRPMSYKLFFLSSSDVATAFSSLATPSSTPAMGSGGSSGSTGATGVGGLGSGSSSGSSTASSGTSSSSTPSVSSSSGAASTTAASISVTQPPGSNLQITSNVAPCATTVSGSGTTAQCTTAASTTPSGSSSTGMSAATPAAPAPIGMGSMNVAAGTGEQVPPDLLIFSDVNSGDDAQIQERLRVLAQLDLPRPEMIITAWVAQNSSSNQEMAAEFANRVKSLVTEYNRQFENVVERGWSAVKLMSSQPGYYNLPFADYLSNVFITDNFKAPGAGGSPQQLAQDYLDYGQGRIAQPIDPGFRERTGICGANRYCLGYDTLFHNVRPTLTDLLMTLVAAQDPQAAAGQAVATVEGPAGPISTRSACGTIDPCKKLYDSLTLDSDRSNAYLLQSCEVRDWKGILGSLYGAAMEPRVHLRCFADEANRLLVSNAGAPPSPVGLLRAALANFLFNYKISQQYPHEFDAYDLTTSANQLNDALNPLVDAFNRDLTAYQLFVRAELKQNVDDLKSIEGPCCAKRLFGLDHESFFNDGLVSVRTISGQLTTVNTTSQSYIDASSAPEVNAILSAIAGQAPASAAGSGSSGGSGSGSGGSGSSGGNSGGGASAQVIPLIGGRIQALANALNQYQTTFAQIGRSLNLTVTPRSLSTASSAEIAVSLNADEAANTPAYTGGGLSNPSLNTSLVANHDVITRVRVDSIKLFDVSSFSATVQRSRSRFPLLPPFVEIPYIGTFAGVPLGIAKEFHDSTAVMSAYVVPTAADLAYGLRFENDLVVDGANSGPCSLAKNASGPAINPCIFRPVYSLRDLGPVNRLKNFNHEMVACFESDTSSRGCSRLTFDDVRAYALN